MNTSPNRCANLNLGPKIVLESGSEVDTKEHINTLLQRF